MKSWHGNCINQADAGELPQTHQPQLLAQPNGDSDP